MYNVAPTNGQKRLSAANIFLATIVIILFSTPAWAEGIPCWIRCHCPRKILSANEVADALRPSSNRPLNCLARSTGILTTYLGKMLGIQGWRNYRLPARVSGKVVQAAGSSDGLYTIDLAIENLSVDGKPVRLSRPSFIRVEVFPLVRHGAPLPVCKDELVCISGKLMWDGDGFLEIHPKHPNEILKGTCP